MKIHVQRWPSCVYEAFAVVMQHGLGQSDALQLPGADRHACSTGLNYTHGMLCCMRSQPHCWGVALAVAGLARHSPGKAQGQGQPC